MQSSTALGSRSPCAHGMQDLSHPNIKYDNSQTVGHLPPMTESTDPPYDDLLEEDTTSTPIPKRSSSDSKSSPTWKVKQKKTKKKKEDDEEFLPSKKTAKPTKAQATQPLRSYSSSTAKKYTKTTPTTSAPQSMNAMAISYMGPPTDGYNDYSHVKGVYKNCRGIWAAQWTDEKGQRHTKYFNPKFFPTENEARISALKFKEGIMQEIEMKGGPRKARASRNNPDRFDYNYDRRYGNGTYGYGTDPVMYNNLLRQQQAAYQMSWAMAANSQGNMMGNWGHFGHQVPPEYAQYLQQAYAGTSFQPGNPMDPQLGGYMVGNNPHNSMGPTSTAVGMSHSDLSSEGSGVSRAGHLLEEEDRQSIKEEDDEDEESKL